MRVTSKEKRKNRERRIERIKERLLRKSMPRLVMTLILVATALSGLLTSFTLVSLGVSRMWVRYPVSILIAYLVFLAQLAVWLWLQGRSLKVHDEILDVLDAIPTDIAATERPDAGFGGAGDFGAGGSGGSWSSNLHSPAPRVLTPRASSQGSASSGGWLDFDLSEGCLFVLAIVAIFIGILASFYVIYIAPALLAEILVDGVLVVGLYRRVKRIEQRHWLRAAIRRTVLPALVALVFFGVAGYLLQRAAPSAQTIGDVWTHVRGR